MPGPMTDHVTSERADGSIACTCGESSPCFDVRTKARDWIINHRRPQPTTTQEN